jgi:Alpha galactosidase A
MPAVTYLLLIFWAPKMTSALDNGLALTPPMGWLSWERFGCNVDCQHFPEDCISEELYLRQARLLVDHGYLAAGYRYVQIDDCWSTKKRNATTGDLEADPIRFPRGMRALADDLHGMGLLLGLYGDIGTETCAGYPGFAGHFEQDAHRLAIDWLVDSIKVDCCHSNRKTYNATYPAFGQALNSTGRAVLYSCSWPLADATSNKGEHPDILNPLVKPVCNQWR